MGMRPKLWPKTPVPKPEPTLREQIAEALKEFAWTPDGYGPDEYWQAFAARVEAFARAARQVPDIEGGYSTPLRNITETEALLRALPALGAPPPERPAQTEEKKRPGGPTGAFMEDGG